MDPPLVNEASFTAAANPSSYSLAGLLSFPVSGGGGVGLKMGSHGGDGSTVTEQSGGGKRRRGGIIGNSNFDNNNNNSNSNNNGSCSKLSSIANHDLIELNTKRTKASISIDENGDSKREANSGTSIKPNEDKIKHEPPKDYIHVRARRGQATDSHSLAERARREKISERMKILQDLVPGCNKVIGKALVLDEIINYIQSLQRQVEFLSMKLEAVNSRLNPTMEGFPSKDLTTPTFDANGIIYGSQTPKEYGQGTQVEWLGSHANREWL